MSTPQHSEPNCLLKTAPPAAYRVAIAATTIDEIHISGTAFLCGADVVASDDTPVCPAGCHPDSRRAFRTCRHPPRPETRALLLFSV